jgi:hypothetical protein
MNILKIIWGGTHCNLHCLRHMFGKIPHRRIDMDRGFPFKLLIGCDCGKIFYSKDEESTARFNEFREQLKR